MNFYDIIEKLKNPDNYPIALHFATTIDALIPLEPHTPTRPIISSRSYSGFNNTTFSPSSIREKLSDNFEKQLQKSSSENISVLLRSQSTIMSRIIYIFIIAAPKYWTPDKLTDHCMYDGCKAKFKTTFLSLGERRHHCRSCGKIFCNQHSCFRLLLPRYTVSQRVCVNCYKKV